MIAIFSRFDDCAVEAAIALRHSDDHISPRSPGDTMGQTIHDCSSPAKVPAGDHGSGRRRRSALPNTAPACTIRTCLARIAATSAAVAIFAIL